MCQNHNWELTKKKKKNHNWANIKNYKTGLQNFLTERMMYIG